MKFSAHLVRSRISLPPRAVIRLSALALLLAGFVQPALADVQNPVNPVAISLASTGVAYTQDFSTLASTGSTSSVLPAGWIYFESGTNANTTYSVNSGTSRYW